MVRVGDGAWGMEAGEVAMGMWGLCVVFATMWSPTFAVVWKIPLSYDFVYSISFYLIFIVTM